MLKSGALSRVPQNIVLCVDDEPIVLRLCSVAVASAGYRAVVAENGAAGLDIFLQLHDEICLVLSDIVMPVMNGIDMAESILQTDPKVKILLMSGYSDNVIELQGRNRFPFIRKPFILNVLLERMRSLIENAEAASSQG